MNTLSLESLLITEDEWLACENVGGTIKKVAGGIWSAIVALIRKLIEKIKSLFKKNQEVKYAIHNNKPSGSSGGAVSAQKQLAGPTHSEPQKRLVGPTPIGIDKKIEIVFIGERISSLSYTLKTLFNRETNAVFTLRRDNVEVDSGLRTQVSDLMSKYPPVGEIGRGTKTTNVGTLTSQLDKDGKELKETEGRLTKLLAASEKLQESQESYRQHAEICRNLLGLSARLATYIEFQDNEIKKAL